MLKTYQPQPPFYFNPMAANVLMNSFPAASEERHDFTGKAR